MANLLKSPLDSATVAGLRKLGHDIVTNKTKREAFLKDPNKFAKEHGVTDVDLSKLDRQLVEMLAAPAFARAVETHDFDGIRNFMVQTLGDRIRRPSVAGTFDADFDVEIEVEIVAIAIAVFDFAVAATKIPDPAELTRRRELVAKAFASIGKR